MNVRIATMIGVASIAAGGAPALAAKAERCAAQPLDLGRGVEILHALRAYTGADGASHVEKIDMKGVTGSYIGGTVKLTQFDFGDPTKVALVYGYPNIMIPPHPAPYREIFLILSGSSTMRLLDGTKYELTPGSIFIAEDLGSTGRGGSAGPCGYVALDLQFKQPPAPAPAPAPAPPTAQ